MGKGENSAASKHSYYADQNHLRCFLRLAKKCSAAILPIAASSW